MTSKWEPVSEYSIAPVEEAIKTIVRKNIFNCPLEARSRLLAGSTTTSAMRPLNLICFSILDLMP